SRILDGMRTGRVPIDFNVLRETFRVRVMVISRRVAVHYPPLRNRKWKSAYEDEDAVIYWLNDTNTPIPFSAEMNGLTPTASTQRSQRTQSSQRKNEEL
ncbi:MAG TPA: hypothetical protein VEJ63_05385, partial [Planctomycetota bacterium]|nr:hypothetical protein [Planctomycetota bacterium]